MVSGRDGDMSIVQPEMHVLLQGCMLKNATERFFVRKPGGYHTAGGQASDGTIVKIVFHCSIK